MPTARLRPEDLRFDPPSLPLATLEDLARERFGISGSVTPMRGERDQNALVTGAAGEFVLKVASPSEVPATVELQCRALEHIARADPGLPVPRLVRTRDGELLAAARVGGVDVLARMLTYLPGVTFERVRTVSLAGLRGIGALQARLANALRGFDHPASANFMPWALDSGLLESDDLWSSLPATSRSVAEPCRERVARAGRALARLRRQVVHNDGHRGNLLRSPGGGEDVVGVIDFGDLVETALAAELGISGASFLGDQPDPVAGLCALAAGFHGRLPLLEPEIDLLPELVLARLALSTLLIEYQIRNTPHIAGAVAAERPGLLRDLASWSALDPAAAADRVHGFLEGTA